VREPYTGGPEFEGDVLEDEAKMLRALVPLSLAESDVDASAQGLSSALSVSDTLRAFGDVTVGRDERLALTRPMTIAIAGNLEVDGALYLCPGSRIVVAGQVVATGRLEGRHSLIVADSFVGAGALVASLQIIVIDSLALTGSGRLSHPSLVFVLGRETDGVRRGVAALRDSSGIDGALIASESEEAEARDEMLVYVAPQAVVRGVVSGGSLDIKGTVIGTAAGQFGFYESPSTYANWVRSGLYETLARPSEVLMPEGFSSPGAWDIAWITELPPRIRIRADQEGHP
jgi:hypothetical protein